MLDAGGTTPKNRFSPKSKRKHETHLHSLLLFYRDFMDSDSKPRLKIKSFYYRHQKQGKLTEIPHGGGHEDKIATETVSCPNPSGKVI
ncbi:hypothetical protein LINPERHAP2_LOCUS28648 [Linum perenne]